MAKTDKAIPEEVLIEEAPAVIQELVAVQVEETWEARQERLKREDFIRRNTEAIAERREILQRNGNVDDTVGMNPADAQRCCI
jgi:predicted dithiol-disulfide oxidoreductase (DUF899 family)